jgi:2-deoxy-D-gluconate 3-dehydrogenase
VIDVLSQFNLANRVAVVTGASSGIGRGLAIGLAAAGADIIVCSRRERLLREVTQQIEEQGRRAAFFVADVSKPAEMAGLKAFCAKAFAKVDILVNSAGEYFEAPAWETTSNQWDRVIDTGLKGTFFCCQAVGSLMQAQRYGKIINLSSTYSRRVWPGLAAYAAQKAAVSHLTEALAVEWARDGVRVNALAPTAVLTPSRAPFLKGDDLARIVQRIPLGRLATIDDLVAATIFLASPASDFVTGQTLFVDGGYVVAG